MWENWVSKLRCSNSSVNDLPLGQSNHDKKQWEREKERDGSDGCNLVDKVSQCRPSGHGFNPYIP